MTTIRPATAARKPRDPRERIEPFGLSPGLEALALQIARLSRLSRGLRADVAEMAAGEIAGHLREGIPPSEIPGRMGDPKQVARRLRRERVRARFILLRFISGWKSAVLAAVLFMLLLYSGALVWFHTARPRISRNFSAEMNAAIAALPGERAEEAYLQALGLLPDLPDDLAKEDVDSLRPGDPLWPKVEEYLGAARPAFAEIRKAAAIPVLGHLLKDGVDPRWGATKAARSAPATPGIQNPMMVSVGLPQLGAFRQMTRAVAADALDAAASGDGARATDDLLAMSGLARHAGESKFLICDLVVIAIDARQSDCLGLILERYPGVMGDEQLSRLGAAIQDRRVGPEAVRFDGERMFIQDFVQRAFTDDGRGDGRLCAAGLRVWRSMMDSTGTAGGGVHLSVDEWLLGPVIAYSGTSRKDLVNEWERYVGMAEKAKRQPRWLRGGAGGGIDSAVEQMKVSATSNTPRQMLASVIPALGSAVERCDDTTETRDGSLVVIALERYRLAHGSYPAHLTDLVPRYLTAVPPDRFDGKPMRYRLEGGKPVVYTVGSDLDDDGGRPPAGKGGNDRARRWSPVDGDHVLWPKPADPP